MLKEELKDRENITLCDNTNLSFKEKPIEKFLNSRDKYHLLPNGTAMLAANIRDCIDKVLGLPYRITNDQSNHQQSDTDYSFNQQYGDRQNYRGRGQGRYHRGRGQYSRGYRGRR